LSILKDSQFISIWVYSKLQGVVSTTEKQAIDIHHKVEIMIKPSRGDILGSERDFCHYLQGILISQD